MCACRHHHVSRNGVSPAILPHTRDPVSFANTEHIPKFISACSQSHPEPGPETDQVEVAASCSLWPCAAWMLLPGFSLWYTSLSQSYKNFLYVRSRIFTLKQLLLLRLSILKREDLKACFHAFESKSLHMSCALPASPCATPRFGTSTSTTSCWHCCWGRLTLQVFEDNLLSIGNTKQFLACLKCSENPLLPHVTHAQRLVGQFFPNWSRICPSGVIVFLSKGRPNLFPCSLSLSASGLGGGRRLHSASLQPKLWQIKDKRWAWTYAMFETEDLQGWERVKG